MTNGSGLCPWHWFPADRQLPNFAAGFGVQVRLKEMELRRPGNGEPVGWLAIFTSSWGWMSSGAGVRKFSSLEFPHNQLIVEKTRIGNSEYRSIPATECFSFFEVRPILVTSL